MSNPLDTIRTNRQGLEAAAIRDYGRQVRLPRFIIMETTEGPEAFACQYSHSPMPYGWRLVTEETFPSKGDAEQWLGSWLHSWEVMNGGAQ